MRNFRDAGVRELSDGGVNDSSGLNTGSQCVIVFNAEDDPFVGGSSRHDSMTLEKNSIF
jgi:hypothetical protein